MKTRMLSRWIIPCLLTLLGGGAWAGADDAQQQSNPWRFGVAVYAWLPNAPVTIAIDDNPIIDAPESLGDLLSDLKFAATFDVEAYKGPFGMFVSPIYYKGKATKSFTGPLGQEREISVEESVWLIKYGASWDLGPLPLGESGSKSLILRPYAGGLFLTDDVSVDISPGLIDDGLDIDTTIDFNTPIVGLNTLWKLSDRWGLRAGGMWGGWSVNKVKSVWELSGYIDYGFTIKGLPAKAVGGYRYLNLHYYQQPIDLQIAIKGPLFAISLEF
jgi:hypothetical protein